MFGLNHRYSQVIVVDWSASSVPKLGKDSIWIACRRRDGMRGLENISTRAAAIAHLERLIQTVPGGRTLIAFDICFGYPRGTLNRLAHRDWWSLWQDLHRRIEDDDRNASNRFEVAAQLNAELGAPLFWGCPKARAGAHLSMYRPKDWPLPEYRWVEAEVRRAQSPWKLAYVGAVGSQTLLGLARLVPFIARARSGGRPVSVWPFQPPSGAAGEVVLAETYLSLFEPKTFPSDRVKDAVQVEDTADGLAGESLPRFLAEPYGRKREIWTEEGWTLGLI